MAITYVDSTDASGNNPTSGDWVLPTGWAAGDVLVVWWYTFAASKTVTPPGTVTDRQNLSGGTGRLYVGYRVLQAGDTNLGWTASSVANSTTIWGCSAFRGVSNSDPFDVADATSVNAASTTIIDVPDITTGTANACVACVGGKADNTTSNPPTAPTIAGSAGSLDNSGAGGNSWGSSTAGSDACGMLGYLLDAGAVGAKTCTSFTAASASAAGYGVTVALRIAPVAQNADAVAATSPAVAPAATVTPGEVLVNAAAATAPTSAPAATVTPGAVSVNAATATATAVAPAATATAGLNADAVAASATGVAPAATVTAGNVDVSAAAATALGVGNAATVTPGPVSVGAVAASSGMDAPPATVTFSVNAAAAAAAAGAPAATVERWLRVGASYLHTQTAWANSVRFYFEVYMRATTGTARARLYDITTGQVLAGSSLTTASSALVRLRPAAVTVVSGHEYEAQVGTTGLDGGAVLSARIIASAA